MLRKIIVAGAAAAVCVVVAEVLPDIKRYLRLRAM